MVGLLAPGGGRPARLKPLLGTCALLWLARSEPMTAEARAAIAEGGRRGELFLSAVTAWEIGVLWRRRGYVFDPDPASWLDQVLAVSRIRLTPLTARQAVESSRLPGALHDDPADRLLAATSRDLEAHLVTRDARLLAYAEAGHMRALAC